LSFEIAKSTEPTYLLFKAPFQEWKPFFKSQIRNHSFCSAGNFAMLTWSSSSSVGGMAWLAAPLLSSVFAARSPVDWQSISSLSLLPANAIDSLLESEAFLIDSENAFLWSLLALRHPAFLDHI
jgi:hypothetical protein